MAVIISEDWDSYNINDDPVSVGGDWTLMTGSSANTREVHESEVFASGVRSLYYVSSTSYSAIGVDFTAVEESFASFYWRIEDDPIPADNKYVAYMGTSTNAAQLRINGTGVQIRDNFSGVTPQGTIVPNQDYRFDWWVSNTAGSQQLDVYTGANLHETGSPDISLTNNYTQGSISNFRIGPVSNPQSVIFTQHFSRIRVNDDVFAAPYTEAATPTGLQFMEWNGTSLVPLTVGEWDGSSLIELTVLEVE